MPFYIYLPPNYSINISRRWSSGNNSWATHIINLNNRPVGGMYFGTIIPDYILWNIEEEELEYLSMNVFNHQIKMKLFEENNTFKFEYCFIDLDNNSNQKYIHLWGGSAYYNGVISISEEIKNELSLSQNSQQMNCKCFKAARQRTAEKRTKATFEYPLT